MHYSVMWREVLEFLQVRPAGVYVDATAGLGGHTRLIAQQLQTGFVISNDRDAESLALARSNTAAEADRIRYRQGRFSELKTTLASEGLAKADGLLVDLGVSRFQLTTPERGFSLQADGPLDMRMDASAGTTAADLVNFISEKELADLIYQLGEERSSRQIARAIVRARPIHTTGQLTRAVESVLSRTGRLHPATQTFMALRMAVNEEQGELDGLLASVPELVQPGGRFVALTFMSLEDRKVKHACQQWAREGQALNLTKHVVKPSAAEVAENPASRSAKLRAVEFL